MSASTHALVWMAALVACGGPACADDGVRRDSAAAFEAQRVAEASQLVRIDSIDASKAPPGLRNELTELSYRWWTTRGRADVGWGVGTWAYGTRPTAPLAKALSHGDAAPAGVASGTLLTLGLRYYASDRSVLFADATGVHGAKGLMGDQPVIGKVGVEFKSARSQWKVAYGGLGLHLNNDTRMTVRVRRGGMKVSMRTSF
ncbi:MAG: hypothetical protein ABIQ60_15180 [Burkholderiaceae bacterium]